jgi:hypothetical protein
MRLQGLFESAEDAQEGADPLVDVTQQYPEEAAWFIKIVMLFGSVSGLVILIPLKVFRRFVLQPSPAAFSSSCTGPPVSSAIARCGTGCLSIAHYRRCTRP